MGGTAPMLLLIYVLCLAAASYLPDSCQLESECRFIYLTSDRTYPEMLRGQIAGGTLLIGDNVLLILLFMRADPLSFLCALGSVLFLSVYLTNALCSGYPEHVSKISFIKAHCGDAHTAVFSNQSPQGLPPGQRQLDELEIYRKK